MINNNPAWKKLKIKWGGLVQRKAMMKGGDIWGEKFLIMYEESGDKNREEENENEQSKEEQSERRNRIE